MNQSKWLVIMILGIMSLFTIDMIHEKHVEAQTQPQEKTFTYDRVHSDQKDFVINRASNYRYHIDGKIVHLTYYIIVERIDTRLGYLMVKLPDSIHPVQKFGNCAVLDGGVVAAELSTNTNYSFIKFYPESSFKSTESAFTISGMFTFENY